MHIPNQLPEQFHSGDELLSASGFRFWVPLIHDTGETHPVRFSARNCLDAVDVFLMRVDEKAYVRPFLSGVGAYALVEFAKPSDEPSPLTTQRSGKRISPRPQRWVNQVVGRLEHLVNLAAGWNGYGSPSIDPDVARAALKVLVSLDRGEDLLPSIVPTQQGGLQLEWHYGDVDLELEINRDGSVELWYLDEATDTEREDSLTSVEDAIPELDAFLTILEVRK